MHVRIGTALARAFSKTRGARWQCANMERHFGFVAPLRDIQGWKSNSARRRGSATRQVRLRAHGVESKILSQQRCVVVHHLNKFETSLLNRSCGPIKNNVMIRNMWFVSHWVYNMRFSELNVTWWYKNVYDIRMYMTLSHGQENWTKNWLRCSFLEKWAWQRQRSASGSAKYELRRLKDHV